MSARYVKLGIISPIFEVKLNKFETFGVKYPEDLITISTTHPNRCLLWSIASGFNKGKKNSNITWIHCSVQPEVETCSYDCDCDWDLHCRKTHVGIRQVRTFTYICVDEGPDPYPWSAVASCKITGGKQTIHQYLAGAQSPTKNYSFAHHLTGKMAFSIAHLLITKHQPNIL